MYENLPDVHRSLLNEFAHGNGVRTCVVFLNRSPEEVVAIGELCLGGLLIVSGETVRISHAGEIAIGQADKGPA